VAVSVAFAEAALEAALEVAAAPVAVGASVAIVGVVRLAATLRRGRCRDRLGRNRPPPPPSPPLSNCWLAQPFLLPIVGVGWLVFCCVKLLLPGMACGTVLVWCSAHGVNSARVSSVIQIPHTTTKR